jgi:hypothetical protein
MNNNKSLLINCQHKIGCFKYIAVKQKSNGKLVPLQVYLEEVQINATPYDGDTITVSAKYKVNYRGKTKWVNENEIYNTKEEILNQLFV